MIFIQRYYFICSEIISPLWTEACLKQTGFGSVTPVWWFLHLNHQIKQNICKVRHWRSYIGRFIHPSSLYQTVTPCRPAQTLSFLHEWLGRDGICGGRLRKKTPGQFWLTCGSAAQRADRHNGGQQEKTEEWNCMPLFIPATSAYNLNPLSNTIATARLPMATPVTMVTNSSVVQ